MFCSHRRAIGKAAVVGIVIAIIVISSVGYYAYTLVSPSSSTSRLTNLTIGTSTATTTGGIVAVAKAQGFFKQQGLNATVEYFSSGASEKDAIAGGSIPIGITGSTPFLAMITGGVPVVLVAASYVPESTHQLIVKQSLNVTTPQGLYGLTIGIKFGSTAEYLINYMFQYYHLDATKIKLVNLSPAELVTAYKEGQIDGMWLWPPAVTQAKSAVPSTVLAQPNETFFGGVGKPWSNSTVMGGSIGAIVARTDWLKSNPTVLTEFLKAMVEAQTFMNNPSNKATAIQDIATAIGYTTAETAAEFSGMQYNMAITPTLAAGYQNQINIMYSLGVFKSSVNVQNYIYTQPLEAINSSLVTYDGTYSP